MAIPANLMGTGKKLPPPPQIPRCDYLVRKGQDPMPGRQNVFAWTPALALRVDEFEPLLTGLPSFGAMEKKIAEPVVSVDTKELQNVNLQVVFSQLDLADYDTKGYPRIDVARERTGNSELSPLDMLNAWQKFKKRRG